MYKKIFYYSILAFIGIICFMSTATVSRAASGTIELSTKSETVKKGDNFYVICRVVSETAFLDSKFQISYDEKKLEFINGGSKVTGGGGDIVIDSSGNENEVNKKTFSLEFRAKKKGYTILSLESNPQVINADGNEFSISSNQLTIEVVSKTQNTFEPVDSKEKEGTDNNIEKEIDKNKDIGKEKNKEEKEKPEVGKVEKEEKVGEKDKTCRLKSLKTSALSMKPDFSPDILEYSAKIDKYTDILYFSLKAENENDKIQVIGNENLKKRINNVKVVVTSENGQKKVYKIKVMRQDDKEINEKKSDEEKEDQPIEKLSNINSISEARNNFNQIKDFILYGIIAGLSLFLLVMIIYIIKLKIKLKRNR